MNNFGSLKRLSQAFIDTKANTNAYDFGEVFTPENIVKAMLDLVPSNTMTLDKTCLEPSCGSGNILVELLSRRLALVSQSSFDADVLKAIQGIYGVDIQPDNVLESRYRMFTVISSFYKAHDMEISEFVQCFIEEILCKNIILGNTISDKMLRVNNLGNLCDNLYKDLNFILTKVGFGFFELTTSILSDDVKVTNSDVYTWYKSLGIELEPNDYSLLTNIINNIKAEPIIFTDWTTNLECKLYDIEVTNVTDMSSMVANLFG